MALSDADLNRIAQYLATRITTLLSGTFAIDSTGIKTITVAHGLAYTPALQDCQLTVVEDTNVDDWAYNLLKVESVDATNVVTKVNVSTASGTGGATAKLALHLYIDATKGVSPTDFHWILNAQPQIPTRRKGVLEGAYTRDTGALGVG